MDLYGVGTATWAVIVPSAIGALQYGVLLSFIRRSGRPTTPSLGRGLIWALTLVLAAAVSHAAGRGPWAGLGAALATSVVVQYSPAVLEAFRGSATSGIARATWLLIGLNGLTWALYGALVRDAPVTAHGVVLVVAAVAVAASTCEPTDGSQSTRTWRRHRGLRACTDVRRTRCAGCRGRSGPVSDHARWPELLLIARHGESAGNVARDAAEGSGAAEIEIAERDMDVDLSELGQQQARALGAWLAEPERRPTVVLSSPYVRARRTAELAVEDAGIDVEIVGDERLREREFGALDRLTHAGIARALPG